MAKIAEKLSPLHALAMPKVGEGKLVLSERLCGSLVQLQAWPNTVSRIKQLVAKQKEAVAVMETGPGRWLVESDAEGLEEDLRASVSPDTGAVTGLTNARVVITIRGDKAEWVLASGIALDFSLDAFPVGTTQVGHHHEIGLTIHRTSEASFDLYVFTSLVRSFWKWLEIASSEVGYSVV